MNGDASFKEDHGHPKFFFFPGLQCPDQLWLPMQGLKQGVVRSRLNQVKMRSTTGEVASGRERRGACFE
jgi:hypothetical protein